MMRGRAGELGNCAPSEKNRKKFPPANQAKGEKKRSLENDDQLLEGINQGHSSRRLRSTTSPETAKNQLQANAVEKSSTNCKMSCLKKKLKANKKALKIPASDGGVRELVANILGIVLVKNGMLKRQLSMQRWKQRAAVNQAKVTMKRARFMTGFPTVWKRFARWCAVPRC
jgi:hypothetical protein